MTKQWICTIAPTTQQVAPRRLVILRALALLGLLCSLLVVPTAARAWERHACTEEWYDANLRDTIADNRAPFKSQQCPAPGKEQTPFTTGYQVIDGRIYWATSSTNRYGSCDGTGVGSLGKLFMPTCYLPEKLQTHQNDEKRKFWLVSEDGAHLSTPRTRQPALAPKQQASAERYAMDRESVYLFTEKIEGADVSSFEVIFPFGEDDFLNSYAFGKDRQHLFIDDVALPLIDLGQMQWLPVPCTGEATQCRNTTYLTPKIGKVGRDILFLDRRAKPTLFSGLATPGIHCSREGYKSYCTTAGKHYLITSGVMTPARLVEQPTGDKNGS